MTEKTGSTPAKKGGRVTGSKSLTPKQRAEAVALWRAGKVTLEDLADKFKKRPETFSRLFKRLGVKKGESVMETAKEIEKVAAAEAVSETQVTLQRIRTMRDEHFKMSTGVAKMAWAQVVRAHQAGIPLSKIKEDLAALKIAGDLIGNARKELFDILNVEKHDKSVDEDDLPDLTVRELTNNEIDQLQNQSMDDDLDSDAGAVLDPELDDGSLPEAP